MRDYNSRTNQDIKGRFVAREVLTCFSYEMESIFKFGYETSNNDLPTFEDIENYYYFDTEQVIYEIIQYFNDDMLDYANDSNTYNRRCKTEGDFEVFLNTLYDEDLEEIANHFNINIDDARSTPHEIYEYWIVTSYMYEKLKAEGQPVFEWGNNCYWGRCTTGQAILLDHVISLICEEMEILDGQRYSWAK